MRMSSFQFLQALSQFLVLQVRVNFMSSFSQFELCLVESESNSHTFDKLHLVKRSRQIGGVIIGTLFSSFCPGFLILVQF